MFKAIGYVLARIWLALDQRRSRIPGRHSAAYLSIHAAALPAPASRPWASPVPDHVIARQLILNGEEYELVRPYVRRHMEEQERRRHRERRTALDLAAIGVDYPYTYPDDQFIQAAAG